jgi:hypothetical protein
VALVYLASGGSKLLDPDWRSGRVLLGRVALYGGQAVAQGVPSAVVEGLSRPGVAALLSALAIGTELGLVVGLWPHRTRALALWWGTWFHLTIEATSRVEGFTWLTLALYALFATPDRHARTLLYDASSARARLGARVVRLADWLRRFEIRTPTSEEARNAPGAALVTVDRNGRRATGLGALAVVARSVPVLFPLWVPIAVLARLARGRAYFCHSGF